MNTQLATQQPQPKTGTDNWHDFGKHRSRLLHRELVEKNVHLYVVEKPEGFTFRPGQAVEMSIDQADEQGTDWRDEKRPFTITSLPSNPRLEFVIKSYPVAENPNHDGMTERLDKEVSVGDRLIFGDAWGAIEYQGPGVFIAGGAGITPFIAILRQLEHDNKLPGNRLFFSNCTAADVPLQGELARMLGRDAVFTLTDQSHSNYEHGLIDRDWLESRVDDFNQRFYLCGPPAMVEYLTRTLKSLGVAATSLVTEDAS